MVAQGLEPYIRVGDGRGGAVPEDFDTTRCDTRRDLDDIFSVQHERTVNQDNTVQLDNRVFQIAKTCWRNTLAGTTVTVQEHLDGSVTIRYGPHRIGEFAPDQLPQQAPRRRGTPRLPYPKAA
jgi:hypothetical protein